MQLMSLLSDKKRFSNETEERNRAWGLLKKIPEYIDDYKKSINQPKESKHHLKNKWGFWPLCDPSQKRGSFEFLNFFSSYIRDVDRFICHLDFDGLNEFYRIKRGDETILCAPSGNEIEDIVLDSTIEATIDISAPIMVLCKEFKEKIEHIQSTFQISPKNQKKHDHLEYLSITLLQIGYTEKEIKELLLQEDIKKLPYDDEIRKAAIRSIARRLSKLRKNDKKV